MGIELFREAFQQTTSRGVFFDNASMGPVAPCVTEAMNACMKLRQTMPMKYYRFAEEVFSSCKSLLAELMGASPEEIAFTESVTYGINSAAGSLPLQAGDNIILCNREFSSNVYPWMQLERVKGIEVRIVPHQGGGLTTELLERYADERTRAVSVSSVEFGDGFKTDLEVVGAWCRAHQAYLVVDCAQSLGVMPMDVKKYQIDVMAGLSSKWLLGPFATGFLYVRKDLIPELIPPFVGADSMKTFVDSTNYPFDLKEDASRFEGSLPNAPGIAGLRASLLLMKQIGFDEIHKAAWNVSGYLIEELRKLPVELVPCTERDSTRSTIVSFRPSKIEETYATLRQNNIACSMRCGYIRTGIHGYNTKEEVDQAVSVLKGCLK